MHIFAAARATIQSFIGSSCGPEGITADSAIVPNNEPFCRVVWDYRAGEKSHDFTGERRRRPTESWPVAAVRQMVFSLSIWLKCTLYGLFVVRKTKQQHICFRL